MSDSLTGFTRTAIITALLTLLTVFSANALAQSLSDNTITSFIDSLKAAESLQPEFEDLSDEMESSNDGEIPDFSSMLSDSLKKIEGHHAYGQLEDLVQDHGFDNLEDWAATGDRVYQAWMAIEMEQQNPGAVQEMNAALAEIENNPNMTAEQKAQMRTMMQGAIRAMDSVNNVPAADVKAVRPHIEALRETSSD